jgi:hypothetical protein
MSIKKKKLDFFILPAGIPCQKIAQKTPRKREKKK